MGRGGIGRVISSGGAKGGGNRGKWYKYKPGSEYCFDYCNPTANITLARALREITKSRNNTDLVIPKAIFRKVVREIMQELMSDVTFEASTVEAIQESIETYLVMLFTGMYTQAVSVVIALIIAIDANLFAVLAKRVTVQPHDLKFALRLRGEIV